MQDEIAPALIILKKGMRRFLNVFGYIEEKLIYSFSQLVASPSIGVAFHAAARYIKDIFFCMMIF